MRYILTFLLLISLPAYAEEEPIVIGIATEAATIPVYIEWKTASANRKVLEFDLTHNGRTHLINQPHDRAAVIKIYKQGDGLTAEIQQAGSHRTMLVDNVTDDRKGMHLLADAVHKMFFDEPGIASSKILYTISDEKEWRSEIWESDYDGRNPRLVMEDTGYSVTPSYMPPKPGFTPGSIVYVSYKTGQPKIYLSPLINPSPQRFSTLRGNQLMPTISPKRDKIAFISDATGNPDLFIQDFDPEKGPLGKPRQIFATNQATQGSPTFSPDGSKIAFVSNKDGNPRIYFMDIPPEGMKLQEIHPKLVSKHSRESTSPAWSPDGKKIAYSALTNGTRQIWVYNLQNDQSKQLTEGPGHKENPSWAANSLHLAYNTSTNDSCELYLINLNQAKPLKISHGPGDKRFPCFGR